MLQSKPPPPSLSRTTGERNIVDLTPVAQSGDQQRGFAGLIASVDRRPLIARLGLDAPRCAASPSWPSALLQRMEGAWLLLAAGLGYVASAVQQWLSDDRLERREMRTRRALRDEERQDRRETFQRETLLALQDATRRVARATGAIHHLDVVHHRTSEEPFARQQTGDEWNQKHNEAMSDLQMLKVRVMDENLRHLIDDLVNSISGVLFAPSENEASAALQEGIAISTAVHERIGQLLREVY